MSKTHKEKRKAKGVDEWFEEYKKALEGLSDEEHKLVKSYQFAVRRGIELATAGDNNLEKIRDLEVRCECLEYEEMMFYIPIILRSRPPFGYVIIGVKNIANLRKYSWFRPIKEVNFDFSTCQSVRDEMEE